MARFRSTKTKRLPVRPRVGEFVSGNRSDWLVDTSARRLTPAKLGSILRQAETGNIAAQYEAFEQIEQDPKVYQVFDRRRRAVVGKPIQLRAKDEGEARQVEITHFCTEAIDGINNFREGLFDLSDATGKAFSVLQNEWRLDGPRFVVDHVHWWPQRDFVLGTPGTPYEQRDDEIRVRTDANRTYGEPMEPGQWIVHRHKARSSSLAQASLMRVVAWMYLFKHYGARDWVIFGERFGMPLRLGKYPVSATDDERNAVERATMKLGFDGAAVVPEGASIEFVGAAAAQGLIPYPALCNWADAQISLAVLGQTLTSDVRDTGARSQAEVHERVEDDLITSDGQALCATLKRDLVAPLVHFNFGPDAPVPECALLLEERADLAAAETDKILAVDMELPMSVANLRRKYKAPAPKDDDDTLVVPARSGVTAAALTDLTALSELLALAEEKKRSGRWAR